MAWFAAPAGDAAAAALPPNYGLCVLVLGVGFGVDAALKVAVIMARKKYHVAYPNLYAPHGHKHKYEFDSVQRGHANFLETYAPTMLQMMGAGLVYPRYAAAFGATYLLGCLIKGIGYGVSGPEGRRLGGIIAHLGDLPLAFLTFRAAFKLLV